jgi:hypothetical protein
MGHTFYVNYAVRTAAFAIKQRDGFGDSVHPTLKIVFAPLLARNVILD